MTGDQQHPKPRRIVRLIGNAHCGDERDDYVVRAIDEVLVASLPVEAVTAT